MADADKTSSEANRHQAYFALDGLCNAFERAGFSRQKEYAGTYTKLLDASELIFGNPNDPMEFTVKTDPDKGKEILRGLKQAFDDEATAEKRRAEDALIFKQKHAAKSDQFAGFSAALHKVLQHL